MTLLLACGSENPGTTAFPQQVPNPFDVAATVPGARGADAPARPRPRERVVRGGYLRTSDSSAFRPCGTSRYYPVTGSGAALGDLRARFRWHLRSMGRPLLAVFRGDVRSDTLRNGGTTVVVERFHLAGVDTLRVWNGNECARARLPHE